MVQLILFLVWFPQALIQVLTHVYWLQTKEYRWDRFRLLFKTAAGRKSILIPTIILKLVGVLLLSSPVLVATLYIAVDAKLFFKIKNRGLVRPVGTVRAIIILVLSFIAIGFTFIDSTFIVLELVLLSAPVLSTLVTGVATKLEEAKRKASARRVLQGSSAKIIGVTGSYGKTTTKKFIAQLLEERFKVAATYKNANTPLMVFDTLAKSSKPDVYVVEMGAYKKGEIKNFIEVAKPDIGVITAVEEQHMFLFGSLQAIKNAKYELVAGIKNGGTAIFNLSGKNIDTLASRAKSERPDLKIVSYAVGSKPATYKGRITKRANGKIRFRISTGKVTKVFVAPLQADFLVENALGAIVVARELGLKWREIRHGLLKLATYEQIMTFHDLKDGLTIIDDSKNSPPTGFVAALDKLATFRKEKIVVTNGIIELGEASSRVHQELAKKMVEIGVSKVFLTSEEFYEDFKSIFKGTNVEFQLVKDKADLAVLRALPKKNVVILLEGRMPQHIRGIFLRT